MAELMASMGLSSLMGTTGATAAIAAPEIGGALSAGSLMGGIPAAAAAGPTIGNAAMLGTQGIAGKLGAGAFNLLTGKSTIASDLASKGLGKIPGMGGASNWLAENPIPMKMGISQQQQPQTSLSPRNVASPADLGRLPMQAPQKTVPDQLQDMINKKLNEFAQQFMKSQR